MAKVTYVVHELVVKGVMKPNRICGEEGSDYAFKGMDDLWDLVQKYRSALTDELAMEFGDHIVVQVEPQMRGFLVQLLKSKDKLSLVDDLVQDTLIKIFRKLDSFRGASTREFWGWCHTIARRIVIDRLRSPSAAKLEFLDIEELARVIKLKPKEDAGFSRGDLEIAKQILASLKGQCLEFAWAHYVEEWTHEEIARYYSSTAEAVRKKISRCIKEAGSQLQD